jgi:peptidoglycan/xylan/chitin deacetylase (PgdA/CDA1 family)
MPPDTYPSAVLMYHRVAPLSRDVHQIAITPEAFRSQLETLTRKRHVVPLGDLVTAARDGSPPHGCVALTFDDGYLDNLEIVLPILEEFSAPATFFLTSAGLPRPHRYWWDVLEAAVLDNPRLGDTVALVVDGEVRAFPAHDHAARRATHDALYPLLKDRGAAAREALVEQIAALVSGDRFDPMARPLLTEEARGLAHHPLIDIGGHTVHHLPLATVTPDDVFREVFDNRSTLEHLIGKPVRHFAYPHGSTSPAVVQTVEAAGFEAAVTCEARPLRAREHPLCVPRVGTCEESGASLSTRLAALVA